ncbi:hypothetical protein V8D89_015771 [Ganoderma adspersum]
MGAHYESDVLQSAVSATPTAAPVAPIDNTFGAILIGNFVGLLMYGIILYQAYEYFRLYSKDTRRLKCLVRAHFLDTLHVIGSSHVCYFYLVTNYFNPAALLIGTWYLMGVVMSIIIFVAQVFYVRRIYLLSRSYRGLVVVMSLLLVGELVAAIEGRRIESTALVAVLVVDLFLASTLVVIFHRNRTGYERTDSLLNILIVYTVNTLKGTNHRSSAINALAPRFCKSINSITRTALIAFPTNMIYFGILTPATRSYTMAVLGVLNSRKSLLEGYNHEESGKASQTRVEVSTAPTFKKSITLVGEDTLIDHESTKG